MTTPTTLPVNDPLDDALSRSGPSQPGGATAPSSKLWDTDEAVAARAMRRLWVDQDKLYRKHRQQWKVNRLRRQGVTGVVLIKRTDTQEWQVYAPPGSSKQVPALNKAARLCRLLRATIFTDPPEPEATPATDSDEDRDGAEFATRVLQDLGAEGNLDNAMTASQAFDFASTYGSGYRYYYMDGQAGGLEPLALEASPQAQVFTGDPQSGVLDPATGQALPGPYVTRYVRTDNTFTDDPRDPQVQRHWQPGLRCDVLHAHVRMLPATARDIWQAHGVLIAAYTPLGRLRQLFGNQVPPRGSDEEKKLLAKGPPGTEDLLPGGKAMQQALEEQAPSDDALVFTVRVYYLAGPEHPKGFYGIMAGEDLLLHRGEWWNEYDQAPLDLPVDQFKQIDDEDSPPGIGMMQILGPGNEIRGSQLGGMLEHLDRFLNRKVFYPINSSLQPRSMQAATGTYIPISPGGEPKHEQVPDFPKATMEMFALISAEMEHESGLEAPATGVNPASVQSGLHARTIIEQVHVGLSDIQQNTVRGLLRGWRIQLQHVRAFYARPRRIGWVGDDGAYKERAWQRSDLAGTRDVRLHKGSMSMLSPSAKAAVAEQMAAMQVGGQAVLTASELRRMVVGNVGGLIGLQDNPHLLRVRRQTAQWAEGPPAGWQPPQPQMDPMTGQPMPPPPDPIFAPEPQDEEPATALLRVEELGRFMAGTKFTRQPPEWRAGLVQEYLRMRKAAGITTVSEQEAQAAAQQEAEQQAQMAQEQQAAQQQQEGAMMVQQVQQALAEAQAAMQAQHEQALAQVQATVAEGQQATLGQVQQALAGVTQALADVQRNSADLAKTVAEMPESVLLQMEQRLLEVQKELEAKLVSLAQTLKPPMPFDPEAAEAMSERMHEAAEALRTGKATPKVFRVQRDGEGRISAVIAGPAVES